MMVIFALILVVAIFGGSLFSIHIYSSTARIEAGCGGEYPDNTPESFVKDDESRTPDTAYFMPEFEEVTFASHDNKAQLHAWWIPKKNATQTIVGVHGIQGCKRQPVLLRWSGMLHKEGFNVLLVDMRDHGSSEVLDGLTTGGNDEFYDVLGAVDWLVDRGVSKTNIGLAGGSLGAATAHIAFGEDIELLALWSDSSFASTEKITERELLNNGRPGWFKQLLRYGAWLKTGVDVFDRSPLKAVESLNGRAVQYLHGTGDERIPPADSQQLFEASKQYSNKTDLWLLEGSEHVRGPYDQPKEYQKRLGDFFRTHLG